MSARHSTEQPATHPTLLICLLYQCWQCPFCDTHLCVHCLCIRHLTEGQYSIVLKASLCP